MIFLIHLVCYVQDCICRRCANNRKDDNSTKASRKIRNTDSFYKDDTIETKKINLTPSLLRDESASNSLTSSQTSDVSNLYVVPEIVAH